jgi:hypothetical protein
MQFRTHPRLVPYPDRTRLGDQAPMVIWELVERSEPEFDGADEE